MIHLKHTDDELCKDHKVQSLVSLHLWLAAVVVSPDLNALFLPGCFDEHVDVCVRKQCS